MRIARAFTCTSRWNDDLSCGRSTGFPSVPPRSGRRRSLAFEILLADVAYVRVVARGRLFGEAAQRAVEPEVVEKTEQATVRVLVGRLRELLRHGRRYHALGLVPGQPG